MVLTFSGVQSVFWSIPTSTTNNNNYQLEREEKNRRLNIVQFLFSFIFKETIIQCILISNIYVNFFVCKIKDKNKHIAKNNWNKMI